MFFRKKDPEDRPLYGTHPGDLGIVLIAALITFGFIYLLLTPQNFGAMFAGGSAPAQPEPAARKGETPMMIYDSKKK
jgi:hypothetical protein